MSGSSAGLYPAATVPGTPLNPSDMWKLFRVLQSSGITVNTLSSEQRVAASNVAVSPRHWGTGVGNLCL